MTPNIEIRPVYRKRSGHLALVLTLVLGLALPVGGAEASAFEAEQREHARVDTAFENQEARIRARFAEQGIAYPPREIFLRVIKRERRIQVWARGDLESPFAWLDDLPICYFSGRPGPKRREGDRQVPEGFYTLDRFNYRSSYHLSLRISYPNAADRVHSDPREPGGDIYIHGGCGSTGCLAVTDEGTEWLYVLAVLARSSGQREIPIHIFPTRLDEEGETWLREFTADRELWAFWRSLRPGFEYFEQHRLVPEVVVDDEGNYALVDD